MWYTLLNSAQKWGHYRGLAEERAQPPAELTKDLHEATQSM